MDSMEVVMLLTWPRTCGGGEGGAEKEYAADEIDTAQKLRKRRSRPLGPGHESEMCLDFQTRLCYIEGA